MGFDQLGTMSKGYDSEFLSSDTSVPLPTFSESLKDDVLEKETLSLDPATGRRVHRCYHNYTIAVSKPYRCALFAALNIDPSKLETTDKDANWRIDDAVGPQFQLDGDYYKANVWDKGHLAPDASAGWGDSPEERLEATNDTYYYTNATLQHENFNRDEWRDLEFWVRKQKVGEGQKLNEITGPVFANDVENPTMVTPDDDDKPPARVPDGFFKVVSFLEKDQQLRVECYVLYQDTEHLQDRKGKVDFGEFQVDIAKIEELTGLVFDPIYHEANKMVVEDDEDEKEEEQSSGTVTIAAAMVNPKGKDSGNEWISLHTTDASISLKGWKIQDQGGRSLLLNDDEPSDNTVTLSAIKPIRLVNTAGSLSLYNPKGKLIDQVKYTKGDVKEGEAVVFHS